jgi:hypothetical protein
VPVPQGLTLDTDSSTQLYQCYRTPKGNVGLVRRTRKNTPPKDLYVGALVTHVKGKKRTDGCKIVAVTVDENAQKRKRATLEVQPNASPQPTHTPLPPARRDPDPLWCSWLNSARSSGIPSTFKVSSPSHSRMMVRCELSARDRPSPRRR